MTEYVISIVADPDKKSDIEKQLRHQGYNFESVELDKLFSATSHGQKLCVCSGGDGSLNFISQKLIKGRRAGDIPLCYLPGGTGNDFSRATGLHELSSEEILKLPTLSKPEAITVGRVNDRYFVNMATCGHFSTITQEVNQNIKGLLGRLSYHIKGLSSLATISSQKIRFKIDPEHEFEESVYGFFVGNSRYCGGGVAVTNRADVSDDHLDLLIIKEMPLPRLLSLGLELQKETPNLKDYPVIYKKICRLNVHSDESVPMSLDGEPYEAKNAEFQSVPHLLKVYLPH